MNINRLQKKPQNSDLDEIHHIPSANSDEEIRE